MQKANLERVTNNAAVEAVRNVLQTHVMFSVLPLAEKRLLEPMLEVRRYAANSHICRQGQPIDGMYIVYNGRVRLKQESSDKLVSVGVVTDGATLGEMSLLGDSDWNHDLVTEGPVEMIVLPASEARLLISQDRIVEEHFKRFVGLVKVGERLRALLGKAKYSAEQFTQMVGELGVKRIKADGAIFNQGDNDPRLYYIESGTVDLIRQPLSGEAISFGRVGRGSLIGEGGAVPRPDTSGNQPHTARAVTEVTVLVIYQATVKKLLDLNPELAEQLRARIRELERYEQEEVGIRQRTEGVDQRIKLADAVTEDEFRSQSKVAVDTAKFKVVKQDRDADNVAACLTMIINHYGRQFPLTTIKAKTGLESTTLNIDDVIRGAENLGFRSKGYALHYDSLKTSMLTGIISLEGYHFAVLIKVGDREVHVADPRDSKIRRIPKDEFIRIWTAASVRGVTDKRPDNFLCIGLIKTLFPDAWIVHTTRDPIDNCLSAYFLHLDHRMSYALDLRDTGHFYRQYRRVMAHWKSLYGTDIVDFDYDAYVRDPSTAGEGLFNALGLDWDPRYLERRAPGVVKTASVWQVREPIYRHASGRASNYAAEVEALRADLADLVAAPDPA